MRVEQRHWLTICTECRGSTFSYVPYFFDPASLNLMHWPDAVQPFAIADTSGTGFYAGPVGTSHAEPLKT